MLLACAVIASCSPAPSPAPTATLGGPGPSASAATPLATAVPSIAPAASPGTLGLPPTGAVTAALAQAQIQFRPLESGELTRVTVTQQQAEATALGTSGLTVPPLSALVYSVGCIYLGYYVGQRFPSVGFVPPEHPAYVVQVLPSASTPTDSDEDFTWFINAETGEIDQQGYGGDLVGPTCPIARPPYANGIPRQVDGSDVLSTSGAAGYADGAPDATPFLVGGWLSVNPSDALPDVGCGP